MKIKKLKKRVRLKKKIVRGICRVNIDGTDCDDIVTNRGLCTKHYNYLWKHQLHTHYGELDRTRVSVKQAIEPGECRVERNGRGCERQAQKRGLCSRCYNLIRQRDDMDINDFGERPKLGNPTHPGFHELQERWSVKKKVLGKTCRLIVDDIPCNSLKFQKGLCRSHWAHCQKHGILNEWGQDQHRKQHVYKVKRNPSETTCRIIEDDIPCMKRTKSRGLCKSHHVYFWKHKLLDVYGTAKLEQDPKKRFKRKNVITAGCCIMIDNGLSCERTVHHRGLCESHYDTLRRCKMLDKWALDPKKRYSQWQIVEPVEDGLCCITTIVPHDGVIDELICQGQVFSQGLCRNHYTKFHAQKLFKQYKRARIGDIVKLTK